MAAEKFIGEADIYLAQRWVMDLQSVGYDFPKVSVYKTSDPFRLAKSLFSAQWMLTVFLLRPSRAAAVIPTHLLPHSLMHSRMCSRSSTLARGNSTTLCLTSILRSTSCTSPTLSSTATQPTRFQKVSGHGQALGHQPQ